MHTLTVLARTVTVDARDAARLPAARARLTRGTWSCWRARDAFMFVSGAVVSARAVA